MYGDVGEVGEVGVRGVLLLLLLLGMELLCLKEPWLGLKQWIIYSIINRFL